MDRRAFLGAVGVAGSAALAGCGGGGDVEPDVPNVPAEPDYGGWFGGVSNYSATKDHRGEDDVTVRVGVEGNGGQLGFGSPAVAVSPDATVHWEWTGRGGPHNVVGEDGAFDSGKPRAGEDNSFTFTFEEPRIYRYVCQPHRQSGMKGAVFCALGDS